LAQGPQAVRQRIRGRDASLRPSRADHSLLPDPPLSLLQRPRPAARDLRRLETRAANYAQKLDEKIAAAHNGAAGVSWDTVLEFVTSPDVWNALPLEEVPLSRARSTFVTFDAGQRVHRDSAGWMHTALALWKPRQDCFLQSQYAPNLDRPLRYPTLADAGWFRHFQSAEPAEPHGWTRPHDSALPRQPEAVHKPSRLKALESPRDLRMVPP